MHDMYVVKEESLFVLRQTRFQAQLAQGCEHPHDVCAYARSVDEMKVMADKHWPNIDYSRVQRAEEDAPLRYIPVAVYTFGVYLTGITSLEPRATVDVAADSRQAAHALAWAALKPSTVECIRHIETRPNPKHVALMNSK